MGVRMPPLPPNEAERLAALRDLRILDTAPEPHFDAVCNTAAALFSVPIALITFLEGDRQRFKAKHGIGTEGTPRNFAFCAYTIQNDGVMVVEDALNDHRFIDNPLVTGAPGIRFYAGAPLILRSGMRIGTLCIIDTKPGTFSEICKGQLKDLATIVVAHIELHQARLAIEAALEERTRSESLIAEREARYRALADTLPQMVWVKSCIDGTAVYRNERFRAYYGAIGPQREERISRNHPADADYMAEVWEQALTREQAYEVRGRLRRHDSVYRWHKIVMIPVRHNGTIVEWLGTALDIEDMVAAHDALEQTTDLLRLAQEAAGAGVWEWNLHEAVARNSPERARMLGFDCDVGSNEWIDISISEWIAKVHPDDLAKIKAVYSTGLQDERTYKVEYRMERPDGPNQYRWLSSFARVIRDEGSDKPVRIVGLDLDITERRTTEDALIQSEQSLRISEERLALALDSGSDGMWDWNVSTGEVWYSDRLQLMLGYEPGEITPHISSCENLLHPDDLSYAKARFSEHSEGRAEFYVSEHRMRAKGRGYTWILSRGRIVSRDVNGEPLRVVGTHIDIAERKAAEQRVAYMARHDALTGLSNRTVFYEHLAMKLVEVRRDGGHVALLCLDLDRFKSVNDTLGHPAGDELLCRIADRLLAAVRECDVVVRLGGDEFAIIVPCVNHPRVARKLAQRVIDAVGQPLNLAGRLVTVGVSIGIALAPTDGDAPEVLFKNADLALNRTKFASRNSYSFYEPSMDAILEARMQLELEMREAIIREMFELYYQPIVRLADQKLVGFEALMRWPHPKHGMTSPKEFVPLAEETGLIVPLGSWALHQACREAVSWPSDLRVAVNVSAIQFQQPGLEHSVISALTMSGLAPERLILEITESVLLQDAEAALACLHRLKRLGICIALDDFGTGYSSLSYLRRFPFSKIKIDRSFVIDIDDPGTAAIVRAIVGIAQQLDATVTAEGVETDVQLHRVIQEGCTEVQGYFFSPPLSSMEAREFISRNDSL